MCTVSTNKFAVTFVFNFNLYIKPTLSCIFKRTVSYFLVYQLTLYSIQYTAPNENSATNEAKGSMSKGATVALTGICPQTLRRILKFLRHESRPEDRPKRRNFHNEAMQRSVRSNSTLRCHICSWL